MSVYIYIYITSFQLSSREASGCGLAVVSDCHGFWCTCGVRKLLHPHKHAIYSRNINRRKQTRLD